MKKLLSLLMAVTVFFYCIASEHLAIAVKPLVKEKNILLNNGIQMEYTEQGNENGIPVILLHGYADSWRSFEMMLPHLGEELHVYALSLRGHGNSSKPAGGYLPMDFANDIAAFMHQLKIEQAIVVGHSMGSSIAQCFAVQYPQLVKGIVLAGAFADYDKPAVEEFRKVVGQLTDPVDPAFVAAFQNGASVKPLAPGEMDKFIAESMKVPSFVWKAIASGWMKSNFITQLKHFSKPALIVWGSKDNVCSYHDQQVLKKTLGYSELLVYQNTGHAVHWEEPEKFAQDITAFIYKNFWAEYMNDEGLFGLKPMAY